MSRPRPVGTGRRRQPRDLKGAQPHRSLAERAYDHLEEMIVTVQLRPGAVLNENALIEQTGFGRTPIREALLRLSDVGLVTIVPRRGTIVTLTDREDQLRLLEVRRELERLIATLAARRSEAAAREAFAAMAREMRVAAENDDYLLFLRTDYRFNLFSAECSRNRHLLRAITPIHALARRFWYVHYRPYDLPTAAKLHAVIMERIAAADADGAARASDALLDYVEAFTRAVQIRTPSTHSVAVTDAEMDAIWRAGPDRTPATIKG